MPATLTLVIFCDVIDADEFGRSFIVTSIKSFSGVVPRLDYINNIYDIDIYEIK